VASLSEVARERTDLSDLDVEHLHALVADWSLLADLGRCDLVLWLPDWNDGGFVAAAQVRATTAPTAVPEDVVGQYVARRRRAELDMAATQRVVVRHRSGDVQPDSTAGFPPEAIPVMREGRVVAVIARHTCEAPRVSGHLEEVYQAAFDILAAMVAEGAFPVAGVAMTGRSPRVGDGLLQLGADGRVSYASPNAVSAFRRLGLVTDLVSADLAAVAVRLCHRPGPVDETLGLIASGRVAGGAEIDNRAATITLRSVPLSRGGVAQGALLLVRDVTELRRRDRALVSKDATIREIHHRVKNNLQTVAALLRLQARRIEAPEARGALEEAVRRIGSIAVVHDTFAQAHAAAGTPAGAVDFDEVLGRIVSLVVDLAPAHTSGGPIPSIRRHGAVGVLSADRATPLAMALSELLQNAIEHAGATSVTVTSSTDAAEWLIVTVVDDGVGIGKGESAGRLGLQIVRNLVTEELHGRLDLGAGPEGIGTCATVTIPGDRAEEMTVSRL
jgi:two-component sensor histidine kinase